MENLSLQWNVVSLTIKRSDFCLNIHEWSLVECIGQPRLYLPYWGLESTFYGVDLLLERVSHAKTANQRRAMSMDALRVIFWPAKLWQEKEVPKITLFGKKVNSRLQLIGSWHNWFLNPGTRSLVQSNFYDRIEMKHFCLCFFFHLSWVTWQFHDRIIRLKLSNRRFTRYLIKQSDDKST